AERFPGEGTVPLAEADHAPLVPAPEKVVCVGTNYRDHCEEVGLPVPEHPPLFAKYHRALVGPFDDIELPAASDAVDWEAELGVVIGSPVRRAGEDEALAAIAGYTIVNDVSMRDWQMRTSQFLQGKTFERSTPVGPFLVTPDEVDHARSLRIRCQVDGEVMQDSDTTRLVFSPAAIVRYVSTIITLVPGDLIATGTPAGVGMAPRPPRYLADGQVLTTTIDGLVVRRGFGFGECGPS